MQYDAVIVGCGIAGITLARRLAEEEKQRVLIVERRNHIGGYCYDYRDEQGILIHRYGPHIFRTNSAAVWNFLSRFTDWHDYQHRVLTYVEGHLYPMPINLDTVNGYLGSNYSSEDVAGYFERNRTRPEQIENVKDAVESQIGPTFYHAFFEKYTQKQWGRPCEELPAEIISRIPIRKNRDNRYFTHKYQAIPSEGYTKMFSRMLDHPGIHVLLNADYRTVQGEVACKHTYYSGSIDEYFDYCFGRLPYRGVTFRFETLQQEYFQDAAVVNYPNDYDYTRITEFKHFTGQRSAHTVIAKEYPDSSLGGGIEPSYPIPLAENKALYQRYEAMKPEDVDFIGRLGRYTYYSMDQVVEDILNMSLK